MSVGVDILRLRTVLITHSQQKTLEPPSPRRPKPRRPQPSLFIGSLTGSVSLPPPVRHCSPLTLSTPPPAAYSLRFSFIGMFSVFPFHLSVSLSQHALYYPLSNALPPSLAKPTADQLTSLTPRLLRPSILGLADSRGDMDGRETGLAVRPRGVFGFIFHGTSEGFADLPKNLISTRSRAGTLIYNCVRTPLSPGISSREQKPLIPTIWHDAKSRECCLCARRSGRTAEYKSE